jgi:hypothetical protein
MESSPKMVTSAGMCQTWIPPEATAKTPGMEPQSWSKKTPRERSSGTKDSRSWSTKPSVDCAVALQLADDGAGVQVVAARQAQALGQHAEVDTVLGMTVDDGVHGAVDVQQHAVLAAPVGQAGVGGEATGQEVVHHDRRADFLGELGALVHLFRRGGGDVQVVTLALAGLLLGLLMASPTNSKRSRQRMKGCELTFSSSLVMSRPPRRHS